MKTLKFSLVLAAFFSFIFFTSCEKNNITNTDETVADAEDVAASEDMFDDAFDQAEIYENGAQKSVDTSDYCMPTITIEYPENTPYPRVVTIDYGTDGCTGRNDVVHKGKIIVTVTGYFLESGSKRIVTFENFYINDYQITGTKTVTNMGQNDAGNWVRKIEVEGKVITPDGKEITRISTREREWIEGANTPLLFWDDVFSITGRASGVNRKGVAYTAEITKPLIKARNCRWIQEGTVSVSTENGTASLDYGDGTCDNVGVLTINGEEREIKFGW